MAGLPIVEVTEAVEDGGELGTTGGVVVKDECLEPDTKLSRALVPKVPSLQIRSS
jgi:hypothetical protein